MPKVKMQAPAGVTNGTIEGQSYKADAKGQVTVENESHLATFRRHGFTDIVESSETADQIKAFDREEVTEYIEERGGSVKLNDKTKALRVKALRMGGFGEEADALEASKKK